MVKQKEKLFQSLSEKLKRIQCLIGIHKNPSNVIYCISPNKSRLKLLRISSCLEFCYKSREREENLTLPLDLKNVSIIIRNINRIESLYHTNRIRYIKVLIKPQILPINFCLFLELRFV